MDKTGIIVVSLCVVLLGWWFVEKEKMVEQEQRAAAVAHAAQLQAQLAAGTNAVITSTTTGNAASLTTGPTTPLPVAFDANAPEQTIVLSNALARYTFTSHGGGLKLIELLNYPEKISARWKDQVHNSGSVASLNTQAPLPVLTVLGESGIVGDGNFTLT